MILNEWWYNHNEIDRRGDALMKKEKKRAILYYFAAVCYYFASLISFFGKSDTSMGIVWLCLGSAMLCLGSTHLNKNKKDKDEDK